MNRYTYYFFLKLALKFHYICICTCILSSSSGQVYHVLFINLNYPPQGSKLWVKFTQYLNKINPVVLGKKIKTRKVNDNKI